ncbi:MAG: phospholipase D-like domain-containing protein [bacterium]
MTFSFGIKKHLKVFFRLTKTVFFVLVYLSWGSFGLATSPIVLFSPKDHPATMLISMINGAQKKIHAAVYMITDKHIADALINAKKRGVDVQVVTDKISVDSSYGKGAYMRGNGVQVFEYHSHDTSKGFGGSEPLMHNKFAIIDGTTWTGSFNWTKSAQRNQENVIILDDKDVGEKYDARFFELKTQYCTPVHGDISQNSAAQNSSSYGKPGAGPKPGPWATPEAVNDIGAMFWRMLPDFLKDLFGE